MTSMVINTRAGSIELVGKAISAVTEEELNLNFQSSQMFLSRVQAKVEQLNLNSEQGKNDWNRAFVTFEEQIPNALAPEVKKVLKKGLAQMKAQKKPERVWDSLQEIYCVLGYTIQKLAKSYS